MATNGIQTERERRCVKSGGFVLMALDGIVGGPSIPVEFLGATTYFRRGIATLHQITGAPVIPMMGRWGPDGGMDCIVNEPFAMPDSQGMTGEERARALMTVAARWLEAHVRSHPGELRGLERYFLLRQPPDGFTEPP